VVAHHAVCRSRGKRQWDGGPAGLALTRLVHIIMAMPQDAHARWRAASGGARSAVALSCAGHGHRKRSAWRGVLGRTRRLERLGNRRPWALAPADAVAVLGVRRSWTLNALAPLGLVWSLLPVRAHHGVVETGRPWLGAAGHPALRAMPSQVMHRVTGPDLRPSSTVSGCLLLGPSSSCARLPWSNLVTSSLSPCTDRVRYARLKSLVRRGRCP